MATFKTRIFRMVGVLSILMGMAASTLTPITAGAEPHDFGINSISKSCEASVVLVDYWNTARITNSTVSLSNSSDGYAHQASLSGLVGFDHHTISMVAVEVGTESGATYWYEAYLGECGVEVQPTGGITNALSSSETQDRGETSGPWVLITSLTCNSLSWEGYSETPVRPVMSVQAGDGVNYSKFPFTGVFDHPGNGLQSNTEVFDLPEDFPGGPLMANISILDGQGGYVSRSDDSINCDEFGNVVDSGGETSDPWVSVTSLTCTSFSWEVYSEAPVRPILSVQAGDGFNYTNFPFSKVYDHPGDGLQSGSEVFDIPSDFPGGPMIATVSILDGQDGYLAETLESVECDEFGNAVDPGGGEIPDTPAFQFANGALNCSTMEFSFDYQATGDPLDVMIQPRYGAVKGDPEFIQVDTSGEWQSVTRDIPEGWLNSGLVEIGVSAYSGDEYLDGITITVPDDCNQSSDELEAEIAFAFSCEELVPTFTYTFNQPVDVLVSLRGSEGSLPAGIGFLEGVTSGRFVSEHKVPPGVKLTLEVRVYKEDDLLHRDSFLIDCEEGEEPTGLTVEIVNVIYVCPAMELVVAMDIEEAFADGYKVSAIIFDGPQDDDSRSYLADFTFTFNGNGVISQKVDLQDVDLPEEFWVYVPGMSDDVEMWTSFEQCKLDSGTEGPGESEDPNNGEDPGESEDSDNGEDPNEPADEVKTPDGSEDSGQSEDPTESQEESTDEADEQVDEAEEAVSTDSQASGVTALPTTGRGMERGHDRGTATLFGLASLSLAFVGWGIRRMSTS